MFSACVSSHGSASWSQCCSANIPCSSAGHRAAMGLTEAQRVRSRMSDIRAHPQEAALGGEAVLHVQQVLGGQLRQPQQTPQAVLRHSAGSLGINIAEGHDADNRFEGIQIRLANLRRRRRTGCMLARMLPTYRSVGCTLRTSAALGTAGSTHLAMR